MSPAKLVVLCKTQAQYRNWCAEHGENPSAHVWVGNMQGAHKVQGMKLTASRIVVTGQPVDPETYLYVKSRVIDDGPFFNQHPADLLITEVRKNLSGLLCTSVLWGTTPDSHLHELIIHCTHGKVSEVIADQLLYGAPPGVLAARMANKFIKGHEPHTSATPLAPQPWQLAYQFSDWELASEAIAQTSGISSHPVARELLKICPGLGDVRRMCPVGSGCPMLGVAPLVNLIPHLNDTHQWSREKIADWLDIISEDPEVDLTIKKREHGDNADQGKEPIQIVVSQDGTGAATAIDKYHALAKYIQAGNLKLPAGGFVGALAGVN